MNTIAGDSTSPVALALVLSIAGSLLSAPARRAQNQELARNRPAPRWKASLVDYAVFDVPIGERQIA
jgi:hypothetical protein